MYKNKHISIENILFGVSGGYLSTGMAMGIHKTKEVGKHCPKSSPDI